MCSASTVVMWVFSVLLLIGLLFSFFGAYSTVQAPGFVGKIKAMFDPRGATTPGVKMTTWGASVAFVSLIVCVITGAVSINIREGFKMTYGL